MRPRRAGHVGDEVGRDRLLADAKLATEWMNEEPDRKPRCDCDNHLRPGRRPGKRDPPDDPARGKCRRVRQAPQLASRHLPDPPAPLAARMGSRGRGICLPGTRPPRRAAFRRSGPSGHRVGLCTGPTPVLGPPAHRQDGLDRRTGHVRGSGRVSHGGGAPRRPSAARRDRLDFRVSRLRRGSRRAGSHGALGDLPCVGPRSTPQPHRSRGL